MSKILVASDAPSVRSEVLAVVAGPENETDVAFTGPQVLAKATAEAPDLVVVDMQMGNMGAMAVCMELRLAESYGALPHVPVLMLLDRRADVFLAKRSGAEGWVVKPLDPIRLRRAVTALLGGTSFHDDSYTPQPAFPASASVGSATPAVATG
ncbi:MAG: response regulator [Acidimicrobiales bacterium]